MKIKILVKFIFNESKNPELTVDKLNEINSIICKLNNNETLKKDIKSIICLVFKEKLYDKDPNYILDIYFKK